MNCFVFLVEENKYGTKINKTQFVIEIPDNSTVSDLYLASLNKAKWNNISTNPEKFSAKVSVFEQDFEQFSDIHEEMNKIKVEPNSQLRFVIQRKAENISNNSTTIIPIPPPTLNSSTYNQQLIIDPPLQIPPSNDTSKIQNNFSEISPSELLPPPPPPSFLDINANITTTNVGNSSDPPPSPHPSFLNTRANGGSSTTTNVQPDPPPPPPPSQKQVPKPENLPPLDNSRTDLFKSIIGFNVKSLKPAPKKDSVKTQDPNGLKNSLDKRRKDISGSSDEVDSHNDDKNDDDDWGD